MVIPIYDDNPFTQPVKPVVTWLLIAVNLIVFFYEAEASQEGLERLINALSLTPAALTGAVHAGVPPSLTLVTYQFFHADLGHLFGNMIFLWVFGDDVERALGRARYLLFYLMSGVIGGLMFLANDPRSPIQLIGASGAIAGVVVAYLMLRPCAKILILLGIIPLEPASFLEKRCRVLVSFRRHARRRGPLPVAEAQRRALVRMYRTAQGNRRSARTRSGRQRIAPA
jgi:rhomboid family protein